MGFLDIMQNLPFKGCVTQMKLLFRMSALVISVLAGFMSSVFAADIATKAKYIFLVDADTNSVLLSKNPNKQFAPASMSKLMTLELLFHALKTGKVTLDDEFRVSEHAWRTGGGPSGAVSMLLPLKSFVKVSDLIKGVAINSANDAAIVIAEGLEPTEEAFAKKLTARAKEIGMTRSNFVNATGFDDPKHRTTARDLALLSLHLIKEYPQYYHYFSMRKFKHRKRTYYNRNPLNGLFGGDGLKTGSNKKFGHGLVASKVMKRRRLILVLHGMKSTKRRRRNHAGKLARNKEAKAVMRWGFRNFKSFKVFDENQTVGSARVLGGEKMYMPLAAKNWEEVRVLLPRGSKQKKVKVSIIYKGPLRTPISQGTQVAYLKVKATGSSASMIPLYATETIKSASPAWRGFDTLLFRAFGWLF